MSPRGEPAPRLLVVLGPTGSGKSALALALGRALGGEIIGCDAVQVYRGFDVGTAKPTPADRASVPHHLVDSVDPAADCSLADWVRAAERAVEEIHARGRVAIVAGGTGLYLRGLLRGVLPAPPRDAALRARLVRIAARRGPARLHRWLARRDPASAARLAPADTQRVVRALELALGGPSWSDRLAAAGTWAAGSERYASVKIGLDLGRGSLAQLLDARVARFFEAGLVAEVQGLLRAGLPPTANAFKAIGYREVLRALAGDGDLALALSRAQQATRRYAKRQRTWFRSEPGVLWLDAAAPAESLLDAALRAWREEGGGGIARPSSEP
jgi:tRNA dimethylallyltransferase